MKKILLSLMTLGSVMFAQAQMDLPQPSPKAVVMQTAGLTDITIDYSSPAVNGRTIWGTGAGALVPYNKVWRTGANAATKITFSKDVKIDGKEVKAGSYGIYTIPNEKSWTIIISKNFKDGIGKYKEADDVLRLVTPVKAVEHRERLAFQIVNFNHEKAEIVLEWEKVRVSFNVELGTSQQAMSNIDNTLNNTWRTYANASRYLLDNNKDLDQALKLIDQSIALNEGWYNSWIKAQILAKKGNKTEALVWAKKAKELGDKEGDNFFYKTEVEKAISDWK